MSNTSSELPLVESADAVRALGCHWKLDDRRHGFEA